MPIKRCDMCFQEKSTLQPVVPSSGISVCKACFYKCQSVIGFLEFHGVRVVYQQSLDLETSVGPRPVTKSGQRKKSPEATE